MNAAVMKHFPGLSLLSVETPTLVSYYNECLSELGIESTELSSFHIDGLGWSPEVAEEKRNPDYLSAGPANPLGIVISPDQHDLPCLHPAHSYDEFLLRRYFDKFKNELADITRTRGITIDFDQGLLTYQTAEDLLSIDHVVVRSSAGALEEAFHEQGKLVSAFLREADAWFDKKLREEIIESARRYGDLRERRLAMPDFRFEDFCSFHTTALGGVFVVRHNLGSAGLLVLETDAPSTKKRQKDDALSVTSLSDDTLPFKLATLGFASLDLSLYQKCPKTLMGKRESILAEAILAQNPDLDYGSLTPQQKKQEALSLGTKLPQEFHELERLMKNLENGSAKLPAPLSPELERILMRPASGLRGHEQEVVWRLLNRLAPIDIVQLYRYDRSYFLTLFADWPKSKQQYALMLLQDNGLFNKVNVEEL